MYSWGATGPSGSVNLVKLLGKFLGGGRKESDHPPWKAKYNRQMSVENSSRAQLLLLCQSGLRGKGNAHCLGLTKETSLKWLFTLCLLKCSKCVYCLSKQPAALHKINTAWLIVKTSYIVAFKQNSIFAWFWGVCWVLGGRGLLYLKCIPFRLRDLCLLTHILSFHIFHMAFLSQTSNDFIS